MRPVTSPTVTKNITKKDKIPLLIKEEIHRATGDFSSETTAFAAVVMSVLQIAMQIPLIAMSAVQFKTTAFKIRIIVSKDQTESSHPAMEDRKTVGDFRREESRERNHGSKSICRVSFPICR